jgi:uncharacterized protein (DUF433 family)
MDLFMLTRTHPCSMKHVQPIDPKLLEGDKIQPNHPLFGLVWINPARVSGSPCFYGTRVPLKILFDSLAAGETLDDFLSGFEGVTREQAVAVLELARQDLLSDLDNL